MKRWVQKESGSIESISHLAEQLGVDTTIANLLVQRGITTFEEAKLWFRPSLDCLHDPFLMLVMGTLPAND